MHRGRVIEVQLQRVLGRLRNQQGSVAAAHTVPARALPAMLSAVHAAISDRDTVAVALAGVRSADVRPPARRRSAQRRGPGIH